MSICHKLKKFTEQHGLAKTNEFVSEAIKTKKLDPYKIMLPQLAEAYLGRDYLDAERKLKAVQSGQVGLLEAAEAQDASAFTDITGQLLITIVKEKYEAPEFIGAKLVRTTPNPGGNLKAHIVPYLSDVRDKPKQLVPGEPYPQTGFAESWVTLPAPEKRGEMCAVTMEMVFSDLTGQAQDSAASIGKAMAYQKDERIARVVLGLTNPYVWNGNAYNTYVTAAGLPNYVNKIAGNTLANYTQVNSAEQLFYQMVDPITNRRILAFPNAIVCMPEKKYELRRILKAVEVRDATTGIHDVSANPLDVDYPLMMSPVWQAIMQNESGLSASQIKEYVVFGDFQKAFGYREVYPLRVEQAPPGNPYEFQQDIVIAIKTSEYGVPYVYDPHYAVLSTS